MKRCFLNWILSMICYVHEEMRSSWAPLMSLLMWWLRLILTMSVCQFRECVSMYVSYLNVDTVRSSYYGWVVTLWHEVFKKENTRLISVDMMCHHRHTSLRLWYAHVVVITNKTVLGIKRQILLWHLKDYRKQEGVSKDDI